MASSHDQDSDCGGDQGSLRPPKSLPKCLPQAHFMTVQGIGRGRGILEQVNELYIMAVRFLDQVLCLASILTQQAFGNEFITLLQDGAVPLGWKEANIIFFSLFKRVSRNTSTNYPTVSFNSGIFKLFMTLIIDHTVDFLIKY